VCDLSQREIGLSLSLHTPTLVFFRCVCMLSFLPSPCGSSSGRKRLKGETFFSSPWEHQHIRTLGIILSNDNDDVTFVGSPSTSSCQSSPFRGRARTWGRSLNPGRFPAGVSGLVWMPHPSLGSHAPSIAVFRVGRRQFGDQKALPFKAIVRGKFCRVMSSPAAWKSRSPTSGRSPRAPP